MSGFSILLPDSPIVTPNDRSHWSERAECARVWRHAAAVLARKEGAPMERARVALDYWPPDRRRRDTDRNQLVVKWCIDGLVDAGILADDDARHVPEVTLRMHDRRDDKTPMWLLTVEEA